MAGGPHGSGPAFTPPTAQTAGETGVALLDYMNESQLESSYGAVPLHFESLCI